MQRNDIKRIALGGMLAAVSVVIMCLGGLIPIATYVCPMLCCMTQFIVLRYCGRRLAWAWFAVVSLLALLLGPDKEAAMVLLAIGSYPIFKPQIERSKLCVLLKLLFFNGSILLVYFIMIYLMGMQEIAAENMELGAVGLVVTLLLGNVTFFLLDRLLGIMDRKLR